MVGNGLSRHVGCKVEENNLNKCIGLYHGYIPGSGVIRISRSYSLV